MIRTVFFLIFAFVANAKKNTHKNFTYKYCFLDPIEKADDVVS